MVESPTLICDRQRRVTTGLFKDTTAPPTNEFPNVVGKGKSSGPPLGECSGWVGVQVVNNNSLPTSPISLLIPSFITQ